MHVVDNNSKIESPLDDLPEELVKALSISYKKGIIPELASALYKKVSTILKDHEDPLSLDQIMIQMYRAHGDVISNRNSFSTKLHNLAKNGHLQSLGKGIYGLKQAV